MYNKSAGEQIHQPDKRLREELLLVPKEHPHLPSLEEVLPLKTKHPYILLILTEHKILLISELWHKLIIMSSFAWVVCVYLEFQVVVPVLLQRGILELLQRGLLKGPET